MVNQGEPDLEGVVSTMVDRRGPHYPFVNRHFAEMVKGARRVKGFSSAWKQQMMLGVPVIRSPQIMASFV